MVKNTGPRYLALALVCLGFCRAGVGLWAEEPSLSGLPEEAPPSLFDIDFGSGDASLLVQGSWELSLLSSVTFAIPDSGGLRVSEAQPILFSQSPDLLLSFLLMDRWFVEARVSSDSSQVRYSAGYRGGEGETLKEIRVGNVGISFPTLPFISFGEGSEYSFGLAATAETERFQGRAMVRYDQAERVVKTYIGSAELTETVYAVSAFVRGRWFATPDTGISNLTLYVQSSSGSLSGGDGKKYRLMESSEFSYSSAGLISLGKAVESRLAASYTGQSTGTTVTIGGVNCVLLYDPDTLDDGTEVLSRYIVAGTPDEVYVRDRASESRDEDYEARYDSQGFVEVSQAGWSGAVQDEAYRQPLLGDISDLYSRDFDAEEAAFAPLLTKEIVVRNFGSASTISVDTDIIEGSVEIYRDGVPDYAFNVDAEAGTITLAKPAGLSEEIKVSYLRESASRSSGSLAAGLAGLYQFGNQGTSWLALAGRLGIPGTSYAEGGETTPGTLVLSGGIKDQGKKLGYRATLAASLTTEEASGRYRITGMESSGIYDSSFAPVSGALPSGFTVTEVSESGFSQVFPDLNLELHRDGSVQRALKMSSSAGGEIELAQIVEAVPVEKLKTLVFFAKKAGTGFGTDTDNGLSIAIDDGGSEAALEVFVPWIEIGTQWSRYVFSYGKGASSLYRQTTEDGDLELVPDASVSYHSFTSSPARITIAATGFGTGTELWIDELLLEDSRGSSALQAEGLLSYEDPALRLGSEDSPLVSGLRLSLDASAALNSSSYASGGLSLETALGPLGLAANLRGEVSEDETYARGGHSLSLPNYAFPFKLVDSFDYDPALGSFGRSNEFDLSLASLASLELSESTSWTSPATEGEEGLLVQKWKGQFTAGKLADASLQASQRSYPSDVGLTGNYISAWLDSIPYILPAAESEATTRSIDAALALGNFTAGSVGKITATVTGTSGTSALHDNEVVLRLALPLTPREGLSLVPYYQRTWSEERGSAGSGLVDLGRSATEELIAAPLWTSLPFQEFFADATAERFEVYTAELSVADFRPELGLLLSRPYGSRWSDLLVPSSLSLAYGRELSREDATVQDAMLWSGKAGFSALNLFGSLGTTPISSRFASDDYFVSIQGEFSLPFDGTSPSWSLIAQHLATFYAGASAQSDKFSVENRLSVDEEPAEGSWSESLGLELSLLRERQWLLDLFHFVLKPRDAARPVKSRIVSSYLGELASSTPRARSIYGLAAEISGDRSDADGSFLDFSFTESYEARLSIPERLTLSVKAELLQERDDEDALLLIGASLSIGLTLSF